MARRNVSRRVVAQALGVSHTTVWRRLSGDTALNLDELERVAQVLGVNVADLMPVPREGRLITVAAPAAETARHSNDRSSRAPERPKLSGRPSPATPDPSTRRPVRLRPVTAS